MVFIVAAADVIVVGSTGAVVVVAVVVIVFVGGGGDGGGVGGGVCMCVCARAHTHTRARVCIPMLTHLVCLSDLSCVRSQWNYIRDFIFQN